MNMFNVLLNEIMKIIHSYKVGNIRLTKANNRNYPTITLALCICPAVTVRF